MENARARFRCRRPTILSRQSARPDTLDIGPRAAALAVPISTDVQHNDRMRNDAALLRGVDLSSVVETTNFLKAQIQLRHSAYYDNEEVTTRVADFLVGAEVKQTETTQSSSIRPSPEFWEALVAANAGLWVLGVCIRGLKGLPVSLDLMTGLVGLLGVIFPLIFLGISLSLAAMRRLPPTPKV